MRLIGSGFQARRDDLYDASGTVGTSPVLVLPRQQSRSVLIVVNTGSTSLSVDFGPARATAVMAGVAPNQTLSSITVANGGFGYTYPPLIEIVGGGSSDVIGTNPKFLAYPQPDCPSPPHPAQATAILTGGSVSSIVINDPGVGYQGVPFVFLVNDMNDPFGAVSPAAATSIPLAAGQSLTFNGTACPTTQVAILSSAAGGTYTCKYML